MTESRWVPGRPSRDTVAAAGGAALFSLSLGLASVALPLLALSAGYSGVEIGVLTAVSALAQMATRLGLGAVMRVFPDWTLVAAAGVLLAASNGLVVVSAAAVPFVLAEVLQGVARACFWTASQTHVVRGSRPAGSSLATVNLVSGLGLLVGPALAGVLGERSDQLALALAAAVATAGCVPALFLTRFPPFSPPDDRPPGRIWLRPGVNAGCWAGVTAGAWRGLLGSYVPVALKEAGQSSSTVGVLISVANAAALVGSGVLGRIRERWTVPAYVTGILGAGLGTAAVGVVSGSPGLAGLALTISGLGAGVLQTVGTATASDAVHPEERGEAIAAAGTFRAAALFLAPLGVAGMVGLMPLSVAMAVAGGLITLPVLTTRTLVGHLRPGPHDLQESP